MSSLNSATKLIKKMSIATSCAQKHLGHVIRAHITRDKQKKKHLFQLLHFVYNGWYCDFTSRRWVHT